MAMVVNNPRDRLSLLPQTVIFVENEDTNLAIKKDSKVNTYVACLCHLG